MAWTTRKISYTVPSGSCAISPDGLTVAYGLSGGFSTDGVHVIKNYGTPDETTFFISNPGGNSGPPFYTNYFYGYGIALDNHGSLVSTTGIRGNELPGSGTGHLYSIDVSSTSLVTANLVSGGNSLLTDGGMYASYFSGDGSRLANLSVSQIVQPFENLVALGSIGLSSGGTVTQQTTRDTGVTLDKPCGQITLVSASIPAQASSTFILTNSYIASTDFVLVNHISGQMVGAYTIATAPSTGSVAITMRNVSTTTLDAETALIQFVVIKSATN